MSSSKFSNTPANKPKTTASEYGWLIQGLTTLLANIQNYKFLQDDGKDKRIIYSFSVRSDYRDPV